MPSDKFFQVNSPDRLPGERIKGFSGPEIYPKTSRKKILEMIRKGDWVRFVVTPNMEIILSYPSNENSMIEDLNMEESDCLIVNSEFRVDSNLRKLRFGYHLKDKESDENIKTAIEKKIKDFVCGKGLEITGIERVPV